MKSDRKSIQKVGPYSSRMSAKDCLHSPTLSEPNSDRMMTSLEKPWDDTLPDCSEQVPEFDYWGDGSLRSPELNSRLWPYISSSPAIRTPRVDGIQIEPITVQERLPDKIERHQTMKKHRSKTGERRRPNFSVQVKERLIDWLKRHRNHPYPDSVEVAQLAADNDLTVKQVRTFFVNNRIRMIRTGLAKENMSLSSRLTSEKTVNKEE
jgi:hypothetical protein